MTAPTPEHLGPKGQRLWGDISGAYDLRSDELRVLEDASREADLVERLEEALRGADLMVTGSQGQLVASPLVSELRQHRTVLANLLAKLKLPDEDGRAAEDISNKARAAANARWSKSKRGA